MANDYAGVVGYPVELLITPDGGAQIEVFGILMTDVPGLERNEETIVPASGSDAGEEKTLTGNQKKADITLDILYQKANFLSVRALDGYELTYQMTVPAETAGTTIYAGTGRLKSAKQTRIDPAKRMHAEYVFSWDGGFTVA